MARVRAIGATVLPCVAIAYAAWLHHTTDQRVRAAVAEAVRAREEALTKEWKPVLQEMYRDMKMAGLKPKPATLEELFSPLFRLFNSFGHEGTPGPRSAPP